MAPTAVAVAAFALAAWLLLDRGPAFGAVLCVGAAAIIAIVVHGFAEDTADAVETNVHEIEQNLATMSGGTSATDVVPFISELAPLSTTLQDVGRQQGIMRSTFEAFAANGWDTPVLDTELGGPVGEARDRGVQAVRDLAHQRLDAEALNRAILANVGDLVVLIDDAGTVIGASAPAQHALDVADGDLHQLIPGWNDRGPGDHEVTFTRNDGSLAVLTASITRLITAGSTLTIIAMRDRTDAEATQAKLNHVRRTDQLTGLANRRGIETVLASSLDATQKLAVICIDLDEVAQINQRHGLEAGDVVVGTAAERIDAATTGLDIVGRLAGSQFIVLLPGADGAGIGSLSSRLLDRIAEPISIPDGLQISLTARAGWSTGIVADGSELIRQASYALGQTESSAARVLAYSSEFAERDQKHRAIEKALRGALANDEFRLFAQPIVDVLEQRIVGVEIFLRWQQGDGKIVAPPDFIPVAEQSDLITEIDRWVVHACTEEAAHADPSIIFSLNMSTRFMASATMPAFVQQALVESGVSAARIQIDVNETNVASDAAGVIESVRKLDELGVKVALDDFGNGFTSMAKFLNLAVSTIKIDRDMVSLVTEPEGRGVVSAILGYAAKRKLRVVAEGVETVEESAELAELGCRYQQGFYHSRPAPLAEVLTSLANVATARVGS